MPKENPDFTKTADRLTNPSEVKELLAQLHNEQNVLANLKKALENKNEEIFKEIAESTLRLAELEKDIRTAIEEHGSYQDVELGNYGVRYGRAHRDYHVQPFKDHYPKLVPAVVDEAINVTTLKGMIAGKVLDEGTLKVDGVITEDISYSFYIR